MNCGGLEMYPEKWTDTTAEALIYKYRVMTVVGVTSCTTIFQLTHEGPIPRKQVLPAKPAEERARQACKHNFGVGVHRR